MKPFTWRYMETVDETLGMLQQYGSDAVPLAGGQTLLNLMKPRIMRPKQVLGIASIEEIGSWGYEKDKGLVVGAGVTYRRLQDATGMHGAHNMIPYVTSNIADQSVRNMATVGGAFCTADPHQDYPVLGCILQAEMVVRSNSGERRIPASEFFVDFYETAVEEDELLVAVRFPPLPENTGWAFEKFNLRPGDYARVNVGCTVQCDNSGKFTDARIVVGASEPVPVFLDDVTRLLVGQPLSEELKQEAVSMAMTATEPIPDQVFSSEEYKRELIGTLVRRSINKAYEQAREAVS